MASDDFIEMEGNIVASSRDTFTVELENGHHCRCHISGKIRRNQIRVSVGDKVRVEVSAYDLTRGRITFRL